MSDWYYFGSMQVGKSWAAQKFITEQPKAQEPAVSDAARQVLLTATGDVLAQSEDEVGEYELVLRRDGLVLRTRQEWEEREHSRFEVRDHGRTLRDTKYGFEYVKDHELFMLAERCKAAEEALADRDFEIQKLAGHIREYLAEIERLRNTGGADQGRLVHGLYTPGPRAGECPAAALLTRSPELEHRLGFGDAGKER